MTSKTKESATYCRFSLTNHIRSYILIKKPQYFAGFSVFRIDLMVDIEKKLKL